MLCRICNNSLLKSIGYVGSQNISISSDMQPCLLPSSIFMCEECGFLQKHYSDLERKAVESIYENYAPHYLSNGGEQMVFPPGLSPRPRTLHALEHCRRILPPVGRLIDIGCGNGAFLKSGSILLKDWTMEAYDICEQHKEQILKIKGVDRFHTGSIEFLQDGTYDFIVLWHVLEHVEDPANLLETLAKKLTPHGFLLLQVPDVGRNPFDLAIFDHCSHFSRTTISTLINNTPFRIAVDGTSWFHNCITLLLALNENRLNNHTPSSNVIDSIQILGWLNAMHSRFDSESFWGPYAMFGTGAASLWLCASLCSPPICVIDEDSSRWGKRFLNIPICSPASLEQGTRVFMPFDPKNGSLISTKIVEQYHNITKPMIILAPEKP